MKINKINLRHLRNDMHFHNRSCDMSKFSVFAVLAMAIGLLFSCTTDIESAEEVLKKAESSSSVGNLSSAVQGVSSGGSLQSGLVFCDLGGGNCQKLNEEVCLVFGQVVASCPGTAVSSSSSAPPSSSSLVPSSSSIAPPISSSIAIAPSSSSSLPSGMVFCVFSGICAEISADACATIGGLAVQSCPVSSSSSPPISSSVVPSSSVELSSSSVGQSSSSNVLACNMAATRGTVGVAISPAPTATCNGTAVTSGLTWTPANLTPTEAGSVSVSVRASSGVCSGKATTCGNINVSAPRPSSSSLAYSGKGNNISSYRTVVIGTQTWMAENLDYVVEGSKCYNNNSSNCATYGSLYNWVTAMALPSSCTSTSCSSQIQSPHRGICPSGWHIPSDAEWTTLENAVGGSGTAGKHFKSTSGWNPYSGIENIKNLDTYGFSALPGGFGSDGSFGGVGYNGYWRSATEGSANGAYGRRMGYDIDYVYRSNYYKYDLFSVRCLQD